MAGWLAGERRRERPTHSHTTSLNKSPKTLFRRRRKRRRRIEEKRGGEGGGGGE